MTRVKEPMLSARKAINRLGITLDFFYRLLWSGRFPGAKKVRGRWVIPVQAVEARLKAKEGRNA